MIIYCSGAIRGDVQFQSYYKEMVEFVVSLGHTALSEVNEGFKSAFPLTNSQIYTRDIKWLERSKMLIAEVSGASLGVGFEVSYALFKLKIPVLALSNKNTDKISALIAGCDSPLMTFSRYTDSEDMKKIIRNFLDTNGN